MSEISGKKEFIGMFYMHVHWMFTGCWTWTRSLIFHRPAYFALMFCYIGVDSVMILRTDLIVILFTTVADYYAFYFMCAICSSSQHCHIWINLNYKFELNLEHWSLMVMMMMMMMMMNF